MAGKDAVGALAMRHINLRCTPLLWRGRSPFFVFLRDLRVFV